MIAKSVANAALVSFRMLASSWILRVTPHGTRCASGAPFTIPQQPRVSRPGAPSGLLLHELVHVVQSRLLGIGGFIHSYVTGWAAAGFVYGAIRPEREAFDLQHRFEREPQSHFCVRTLVSRRLGLSWRSPIRRRPSRLLEFVPATLACGRLFPM
ncbi:MAG: hypothetical protein QNI93_19870 [Kiloniellales bacterium]|nr:hypothetical protein [Kiloniellales bacterium]MDJ0982377.1 hypothetical protein [Kiloniellales bacterium]